MAQVINTNVMSLNSQRSLNRSQSSMSTALERLSSGLRINRAKDDAAGLAVAERFTVQIRGMDQAIRNANDGISMAQTGEGALQEITVALQRMRELAVQANNGTMTTDDRNSLNDEYDALKKEITRITDATEFNGKKVIGSATSVTLQVGHKGGTDHQITLSTVDAQATHLASLTADIKTAANASAAMSTLSTAIDDISAMRADYGAVQNRLEMTVRNLQNVVENQSAARSRILDADFARETAELTRTQILQQAGVAMLAQANTMPQNALSLLR